MILYGFLVFLMFSDDCLIQRVNIKSLKCMYFLTYAYQKMLTSAKAFTQSKLKVFNKNLIHQRIS